MTTVIHIKNAPKEWEYNSNYAYIGRSGAQNESLKGYYGNPYSHKKNSIAKYIVSSREEAVEKYKEYFYERIEKDDVFLKNIEKLRDKVLVCWCKIKGNESCHGDVIKEYLDNNCHYSAT